MSQKVLLTTLLLLGVALLALGFWVQDWWPLAGGVVSLTGAAWLVTEPA
jgi:hypothetical protein